MAAMDGVNIIQTSIYYTIRKSRFYILCCEHNTSSVMTKWICPTDYNISLLLKMLACQLDYLKKKALIISGNS